MSQDPASNLLFNQVKAGIKVDAQKMAEKIKELSKDTKYFQYQKKRSKNIDEQVQAYQEKLKRATPFELKEARTKADKYIAEVEAKRSFQRTFFHADLDAFYAAVEALDDPSLVGTAYAVGGEVKHGVIATSSYEARKSGIRAGMAVFLALQLCPGLKIIDPHMDRYKHFSSIVHGIFARYDSKCFRIGLDEALLEMTDYLATTGADPRDVAKEIQEEVTKATRLTVSIGIAPTPQLAKIASDANKPNGYFMIEPNKEAVEKFLQPLPIRKIPGVGGARERLFQALGMEKVSDVLQKKDVVFHLFSEKFIGFLIPSCLGVMVSMPRDPKTPQKSYSREETFDATNDFEKLKVIIARMAVFLSGELKKRRVLCNNIGLKFKTVDFTIEGASKTLKYATSDSHDIETIGLKILRKYLDEKDSKLRLLGLKVSQFTPETGDVQKKLRDMLLAPAKPRAQALPPSLVEDVFDVLEEESEDELAGATFDQDPDVKEFLKEEVSKKEKTDINRWVVTGQPTEAHDQSRVSVAPEESGQAHMEKKKNVPSIERWAVAGQPIQVPPPTSEVHENENEHEPAEKRKHVPSIDRWVVPKQTIGPEPRAKDLEVADDRCDEEQPEKTKVVGSIDRWVIPGQVSSTTTEALPESKAVKHVETIDKWARPKKVIDVSDDDSAPTSKCQDSKLSMEGAPPSKPKQALRTLTGYVRDSMNKTDNI